MQTLEWSKWGVAIRADLGDGCALWIRRTADKQFELLHQHRNNAGVIHTGVMAKHRTKKAALADAEMLTNA